MISKFSLITLLVVTTIAPLYVIISIEPKVKTYHLDFAKYEFPIGTSKKDIDEILGKPHEEKGKLYYFPWNDKKYIGFTYHMKYNQNKKLIAQDLNVGCTPNIFSVRDYSPKEKLLKYFGFEQTLPAEHWHFKRAKNVLKKLDQFLEANDFQSIFKVDEFEEKL